MIRKDNAVHASLSQIHLSKSPSPKGKDNNEQPNPRRQEHPIARLEEDPPSRPNHLVSRLSGGAHL